MGCSLRDTRALFIICCVELLERLAGYLVSVSLVFYLNEAQKLPVSEANHQSGWVFGLSYAAAICGGLLCDWLLGARATTLLGLTALGISLIGATVMQTTPLWLWGTVFVVGNGLFKPGIVSLLNETLPNGHPRRSFGFALFYVAVNLGSAFAPPLGAWAQSRGGWSGVSGAAGMGMALGTVVLLSGWRVLGGSSFLVMMLPSALNEHGRSSPLWLVLCNVTLTVGEMLVLPSALSLLGSLAPAQRSGLLSGLSFGAQALGFWVGGLLGAQWEQWSSTTFFAVQSVLALTTSLLLTLANPSCTGSTHTRAQQ
jgi:dipeptide/tripeptide permease